MRTDKNSIEGRLLRAAISKQLREKGLQTVADVATAIDRDVEVVRAGIMRMVKGGQARSVREQGKQGWSVIARYHLVETSVMLRNAGKPYQPILTEYPANNVRDPYALPVGFFCARAA